MNSVSHISDVYKIHAYTVFMCVLGNNDLSDHWDQYFLQDGN